MSNGLDLDLGPNCLQRLSVDDKSGRLKKIAISLCKKCFLI